VTVTEQAKLEGGLTVADRTEDRHTPEPSVSGFELRLGAVFAERLCGGCRKKLGSGPRRMLDHKQYHPGCEPKPS
jgi:hypothetical protein